MRHSEAQKAPIFAALGDETRLALLWRLSSGGAQSIARLTEGTDLTRQAVTKHLRVLEGAGLVRSAREGRESSWAIEPRRIEEAKRYLERIEAAWDARLDRLAKLVEE